MVNKNKPVRGRRYKYGEPLDVKREVKFTESQNELIEKWQQRMGVNEVGDLFRDTLLQSAIAAENADNERPFVPLFGEIPASPAVEVIAEPPGQYIRPPFDDLSEMAYALTIRGESMTAEFGISAPNGFYGIFEPRIIKPHMIVHVEFSEGNFEHKSTLKKYLSRGNGTSEFRPLNPEFETIVVEDKTFTIKGGLVHVWDGVSGAEGDKAK